MHITTAEVFIFANVLAWVAGAFHHYSLGQKIKSFITQDAPVIANVGNEIVKGAEEVFKSPVLAPVELKLHHTLSDLADSRLAHLAVSGILAARNAFDTAYADLSANEKAAIVNVVKAEAGKLGQDFTVDQISRALDDMKAFVDNLAASPVFANTKALDESLKALTASVDASTEVANG